MSHPYVEWLRKDYPSIIPPQDCRSTFPPKPPIPKPEPQVHLITNECCGNFKLPCGSSNFTVWNTTDTAPAGTVSILYSDGCAENLTVSVIDSSGNTDTFQVPPENTISRTYKDLVMVSLTCPSGPGNNNCSGKYCITISYSVQD